MKREENKKKQIQPNDICAFFSLLIPDSGSCRASAWLTENLLNYMKSDNLATNDSIICELPSEIQGIIKRSNSYNLFVMVYFVLNYRALASRAE